MEFGVREREDCSIVFLAYRTGFSLRTCSYTVGKMQVPFSMAVGNGELMHDCFPKHSCMGTAKLKYDKETDEECKKRGVRPERSKESTKKIKKSRRPITTQLKYINTKHNIAVFYKILKKYNEIQFKKYIYILPQSKNEKSSNLPRP